MNRPIVIITEEEMTESMMGTIGPLMICRSCDDRDYIPMESDAYNYKCPSCGEKEWCSAEELLIRGELEIN